MLKVKNKDKIKSKFKVKLKNLDNFLSGNKLKKISFIKIDVEGAEWMVLNGMRECIRKWNPKPIMLIEIGWGTNHPNREKELAEFNYLFDNGYKKITLDDVDTTDKIFIPN